MGIFSKLFGSQEKRKVEELYKDFERKNRPISNLAQGIVLGSLKCVEALKPYLTAPTQKERDALNALVCYQFIYFFTHLMHRHAFKVLGSAGLKKLQDEIAPYIAIPAISIYFDHLPNNVKKEMVNQFFDGMNQAETDYSTCCDIIPPDPGIMCKEILEDINSSSAKYILSKLISRLFKFCGNNLSPKISTLLIEFPLKTFFDMNIKHQIEEIKKVL